MAYLDTKTQKPSGLTAALTIHGVALAALFLIAPVGMEDPPKIFRLINPTSEPPRPVDAAKTTDRPAADDRAVPLTPPAARDTERVTPKSDLIIPGGNDLTGPIGTLGGVVPQPLPDIKAVTPVLTDARINTRFADALQPSYPPGLIRQNIEGVVVVRVLVGTNGRVTDVTLVRADHPDLFSATERQARAKWRFHPATRDGVPIESWHDMTVRFEIPG